MEDRQGVTLVKAFVDDDLGARIKGLAERGNRTVAAELRRALRHWVEREGVSDGGVIGVAPSSLSPPPPVLPPVKGKQRTATCAHRRPVSSFCRYCDA